MRDQQQGGARWGPPILLLPLLLLPGALSGQKNGAKTEACDPGPVDMSLLYIPTSLLSSPDGHTHPAQIDPAPPNRPLTDTLSCPLAGPKHTAMQIVYSWSSYSPPGIFVPPCGEKQAADVKCWHENLNWFWGRPCGWRGSQTTKPLKPNCAPHPPFAHCDPLSFSVPCCGLAVSFIWVMNDIHWYWIQMSDDGSANLMLSRQLSSDVMFSGDLVPRSDNIQHLVCG